MVVNKFMCDNNVKTFHFMNKRNLLKKKKSKNIDITWILHKY